MSADGPPKNSARAGDVAGRIARLTLKELREILRDRRTIITLLLMPALVYPILSVVFQKFLLTSFRPAEEVSYAVGLEPSVALGVVSALMKSGEDVLRSSETGHAPSETADAAPTIKYFGGEELEARVADLSLDLGVRVRMDPQRSLVGGESQMQFELLYREGSVASEDALRYFESRLQAVNTSYLRRLLQQADIPSSTPTRTSVQALKSTASGAMSLATLAPLILILMTITGAVYPAIDLTAGERERGTLEALIAAPIPRLGLLLSKYVAVLTVALLTAAVNLISMTVTLYSSGLASRLFGGSGLSVATVAQVFGLLVLFAAFFSAVLLAVTSFARSFKEAQAYLIPLMLISLGPGMLSLIPNLKLSAQLAVTPLVNCVLLARDTFSGDASASLAAVVVISTALYALAAIGVAARIFGADAILYGGHGHWSDLFRRPQRPVATPSVSNAVLCLALMFPAFFVLSNSLALWSEQSISFRLAMSGLITALLFGAFPLAAAYSGHVRVKSGFGLRAAPLLGWLGAMLLGFSLWPFAHELFLIGQWLGLASLNSEQISGVAKKLLQDWQDVSPVVILLAMAATPAVFEELFFRGYLFNALRAKVSPGQTILITALLFGAFHVVTNTLATERFLPSTFLGLVLGWVCYRSHSVLPGMLLHFCHNGFLLMAARYQDKFKASGWDLPEKSHMPFTWLLASAGVVAVAAALLWFCRSATQRQRPIA